MKMMKNVFFFRASRYEAADTMNGKCSNTMREKFRRLIAARFITQERNDRDPS